jgi:DNA-binding NarL/FixJ family response regulator
VTVSTVTVLIADDHGVVADSLAALLKDRFRVLGIVHDGRALIEAAKRFKPDVILTDIAMPGLNGIDAIARIKKQQPACKVVVLTMHDDEQLAAQAFRSGASGYVLKSSPGEELVTAIEEVSQGRAYLSPLIARGLIDVLLVSQSEPPEREGKLSARQREVLQLLAEGKTMKEIAVILHISPRTVESHKYEMMQTLRVATSAELVQCAVRLKLVGS